MKHPMQPLVIDNEGVVRFQKNEIVRFLLDWATEQGVDLNTLAGMHFSQADRTQFAQLIGMSLCGFHELPYVSDTDAAAASAAAQHLMPGAGGCRDDGCRYHSGVADEEER